LYPSPPPSLFLIRSVGCREKNVSPVFFLSRIGIILQDGILPFHSPPSSRYPVAAEPFVILLLFFSWIVYFIRLCCMLANFSLGQNLTVISVPPPFSSSPLPRRGLRALFLDLIPPKSFSLFLAERKMGIPSPLSPLFVCYRRPLNRNSSLSWVGSYVDL